MPSGSATGDLEASLTSTPPAQPAIPFCPVCLSQYRAVQAGPDVCRTRPSSPPTTPRTPSRPSAQHRDRRACPCLRRVEVVRRVRLRQPPHAPRELHAERIVGTKLTHLHLPHNKHRQGADDDPTRGTASPRVTTSRAAMRSWRTPARPCFSAARMPFACATTCNQATSRRSQAALSGLRSIQARTGRWYDASSVFVTDR
jgi:hypothetical protein